MIESGPWVRGAGFADGLLFPGRPRAETCDLHLTPDGVRVSHGAVDLVLAWHDHEPSDDPAPGRWNVSHHTFNRAPIGIGLLADADLVQPMRHAIGIGDGLLARYLQEPRRIPLFSRSTPTGGDAQLIDQIAALMAAIAKRPTWQANLADPTRVAQLCRALRPTSLATAHPRGIDRRRPAEVARALRLSGFVHDIGGRPVAASQPADETTVLDAVTARVRRHPDHDISQMPSAEISKHVHRIYLDVTPWPFDALA